MDIIIIEVVKYYSIFCGFGLPQGKFMRCVMNEMPLEFMFAIAKDKSAMRNFVALDDSERSFVLARARRCKSKEDFNNVAMSLSDYLSATEKF